MTPRPRPGRHPDLPRRRPHLRHRRRRTDLRPPHLAGQSRLHHRLHPRRHPPRRAPLRLHRLGPRRHRPRHPPAQLLALRSRHPAHRRQPRRPPHPRPPRPRPGQPRPRQHRPGHHRHHPRERLTATTRPPPRQPGHHKAPPTRRRGLSRHRSCPPSTTPTCPTSASRNNRRGGRSGNFVLVNLLRGQVGAPVRPRTIGDLLAAASRRAGLAAAVTPHQLRHSFGSNAEVSGVASAASFGGSREHALPGPQRPALRCPPLAGPPRGCGDLGLHGPPGSDANDDAADFVARRASSLHLLASRCIQSPAAADASSPVPRRPAPGRHRNCKGRAGPPRHWPPHAPDLATSRSRCT